MSDACFAGLRRHFTEPEIAGLTFIVGYQTFASKFAKAFQLAPQGSPAGRHDPLWEVVIVDRAVTWH